MFGCEAAKLQISQKMVDDKLTLINYFYNMLQQRRQHVNSRDNISCMMVQRSIFDGPLISKTAIAVYILRQLKLIK